MARLHVESLLDKRNKSKVLATLARLLSGSAGLNDAYNEALKRIESQLPEDAALARAILTWISCAETRLTTEELRQALAIRETDRELDEDNLTDIEDIVSVCAGLVVVDEESGVIGLVHYTMQEYFEVVREKWNPTAQYDVATTCLTHLCFKTLATGGCFYDSLEEQIARYPFLNYAAQYWGCHVTKSGRDMIETAMPLLLDNNLSASAAQVLLYYKDLLWAIGGFGTAFNGLHLTSMLGLQDLLNHLIHRYGNDSAAANFTDDQGRTPLSYAAKFGNTDTTAMLLNREDVDVNLADNLGRGPLPIAAACGQSTIGQLLIDQDGIELNKRDLYGHTPLLLAVMWKEQQIVEILVRLSTVNVNAQDPSGYTALHFAARNGDGPTMKLLLRRSDIKVNVKDNSGRSPLSYVAHNGAFAQLIVSHSNWNFESDQDDANEALLLAAQRGTESVFMTLFEMWIVNHLVEEVLGDKLLLAAAWGGNYAIVKKVWEHGRCDIDCEDEYGEHTPLMCAAEHGHETITKFLLAHGASAKKSENGRCPISFAAEEGHLGVMKLLLKSGAPPNEPDMFKMKPIYYAADRGHKDIVIFLLENGARDEANERSLMRRLSRFTLDENEASLIASIRNSDVKEVYSLMDKLRRRKY